MHVKVTQQQIRTVILTTTDSLADRLIEIRRDLHAHPEVSWQEHRTTELIVRILTAVGLAPTVLPIGTGVLCDIVPDGVDVAAGLTGLRADIDALPITDTGEVEYISTNPGVCHACGHDVHTTILLGVGLVLTELNEQGLLNRAVRLIFQPAEECNPGGALDAIDGGALTNVTEVYALHCEPHIEVGLIGIKTGSITSATDTVLVRLKGTGGHTSRPQLAPDLVGALGAVATQTPLLLSRLVDPRGGASLIWGRIEAGSAANAIPRSGEIEGTLRALDLDGWQAAGKLLPTLITQIVEPYGVEIDIELTAGVPPTVNYESGVARITSAATRILGPASIIEAEQSLGGEDFSWMLQEVPGALARLGVRSRGAANFPDIHHPSFRVDEKCIAVGVKLFSSLAANSAVGTTNGHN